MITLRLKPDVELTQFFIQDLNYLAAPCVGVRVDHLSRIPIEASAATAFPSRARCHAGQQALCSHVCPLSSVPNGSNGSPSCSEHPQPRHRPSVEGVG